MRTLRTLVVGLLVVGCGSPTLIIRHQDPTHRKAVVVIDGEKKAQLELDDEIELDLREGPHTVRVVPPGEERSPWHEGDHVPIVLESEAVFTLLPRARP